MAFPIYFSKTTWLYVVFVYIFFASVTTMWLLKQPRDYLTMLLFVGTIVAAVVGVLFYNPTISLPAFTGFTSETGSYMFPTLFITIACGAVSGFHSLVSSETSSKQIKMKRYVTSWLWFNVIGITISNLSCCRSWFFNSIS
ncbi:MAG: carbon starvation CstA family protein [Thomasclavelia ramosa]